MAPISLPNIPSLDLGASIPTTFNPSLRNFTPRSLKELAKRYNNCAYYSTSCSRQRTIIIIIIVFVLLLMVLILFLLFRRHQTRRVLREQEAIRVMQQIRSNEETNRGAISQNYPSQNSASNNTQFKREDTIAPPPPYEASMPRKPEAARSPEIRRSV